jgi:glutathione peroxidase
VGMTDGTGSDKPQTIYDITIKGNDGKNVSLEKFKGKVLLVVNVASQCGLANGNYTQLTDLYARYKDKGLEILAFPCNQFGLLSGQEPGSDTEIKEFVCTRFKADYPLFAKCDVNGTDESPVYKFLKGKLPGSVKWNFTKFLVDRTGKVVDRYLPTTKPESIVPDIEKLLAASA